MTKIGVYILKGSRYYVGSTNDLNRRLIEHKRGQTETTKRIGKWDLVEFLPCTTLDEARILERKIKRSKNVQRWLKEQPRT
jgi:predicted GIY-YIG superfamily endonuclease